MIQDVVLRKPNDDCWAANALQRSRYNALARICALPGRSADVNALCLQASSLMMQITAADSAVVYLVSHDRGCMIEYSFAGEAGPDIVEENRFLSLSVGRMEQMIESRRCVVVDFATPHPSDVVSPRFAEVGYKNSICVPFYAEGEVVGFYALLYKSMYSWSPGDEDFLIALGQYLGIAVQNSLKLQAAQRGLARRRQDEGDAIQQSLGRILSMLHANEASMGKLLARSRDEDALSMRCLRYRQEHPVEELTQREREILRLLAEGLSNEEIGRALYVSEGTVKKQLSSLLEKLQVKNRVQAVAYAFRAGYAS
ncbi:MULTISPECIES: LuxR C-terminal-related transcriptional regulator [unclassified Adlercreutzia]|uniref:LuxR C-terminal-related transcriptional regulator n=1 Tax=unclassified Adlercreutzia TaxID=2636013 RepID=UPI0013EE17E5|nr:MULTISPECIES: LuxR C-terminal-related transcriptional regulator [unclassified Adlercreutzia]